MTILFTERNSQVIFFCNIKTQEKDSSNIPPGAKAGVQICLLERWLKQRDVPNPIMITPISAGFVRFTAETIHVRMMSAGYNDIPSSPGGDSSITIDSLEVSPNVSHAFNIFKQFNNRNPS